MKNIKLITAILVIAMAVGGAFVTNAEVNKNAEDTAMLATADEATQLGYYRTVPSNPASCTSFSTVECNPVSGPTLCQVPINGQMKQLYDNDCASILYTDPVQ